MVFSSKNKDLIYKLKSINFDVIEWEKKLKSKNQCDLIFIDVVLNELSHSIDEKKICWIRKKFFFFHGA